MAALFFTLVPVLLVSRPSDSVITTSSPGPSSRGGPWGRKLGDEVECHYRSQPFTSLVCFVAGAGRQRRMFLFVKVYMCLGELHIAVEKTTSLCIDFLSVRFESAFLVLI